MDSDWIQTQARRAEGNAEHISRLIDLHHPPHDNLADTLLERVGNVRSILDTIESHIKTGSTLAWYDDEKRNGGYLA